MCFMYFLKVTETSSYITSVQSIIHAEGHTGELDEFGWYTMQLIVEVINYSTDCIDKFTTKRSFQ